MKNITLSVDDETYHEARIEAARRKTSVSGLVREALRALTAGRQPPAKSAAAEKTQRLRLVKLLAQCQIDLTERPTREATYASRRLR